MCSIPGLPTPGTEVPVLLTRVNLNTDYGLVELWVNMDDDRKHIYEQLREEIKIPNRRFSGSEGKPGDLCLVYMSDAWHRARIVSLQRETYDVFLIDQGQFHTATSETLAWGNSDSFLLPPEIESCILANVFSPDRNWSERATKFLKSLPGKKFKALVQHVLMPDRTIILDIPTVSNHMCMFRAAKKIPGNEFKNFVLKCLHLQKKCGSDANQLMKEQSLNLQPEKLDQYFFPELSVNMFETVTVTEVIDPNNIYCKLLIFSKALKLLSEQIHQHYEQRSDLEDPQPQNCGSPCAAKGTNGRWHRSLLKGNAGTSDSAVEVLHVDDGKTELVPVGDIKPLHRKFLKMPVVTYLCALDGVEDDGTGWTTGRIHCLKSLLLNQTVIARFHHHSLPEDVYYATLYAADSASVNDCFMENTGLLPPYRGEHDVQKAPIPSVFLTSLKGGHLTSKEKEDLNIDVLPKEPQLSTKNQALNGKTDIHSSEQEESSECLGALSNNDQHLSAGFPNSYFANYIEVGRKEKVWVTSAETIHHFYCQLERNSQVFNQMMANVNQLMAKPQCKHLPLGLDSICFARYSDGQWYRGQIVEVSPELKVHFVDYGDTVKVTECDIQPFPSQSSVARSVPVLAVPLGLFDVPLEVPQEVNQWFADNVIGHIMTILVVAKGPRGKLIIELFNGSTYINETVRERILKVTQQKMNGLHQQPDYQLPNCSQQPRTTNEYIITHEDGHEQALTKSIEEKNLCAIEKPSRSPESVSASEPETEYAETFEDGQQPVPQDRQTAMTETFIQGCHSDSETIEPSSLHSERNVKVFQRPNIHQDKTEEVSASWIVGPHYFWCQHANTEDLSKLSRDVQEAGRAQQDIPDALGLGSPCLALSPSNNQWYRAQVIQRVTDNLHVLFVDYGERSYVNIKDVRSLPAGLLEVAPQAFLCQLDGFDESKGSWDVSVNEDFYNVLINKQFKVTVLKIEEHAELAVPQYTVNVECENVVINTLMQKYWNSFLTEKMNEISQMDSVLEHSQNESNATELDACLYRNPKISKDETVEVYASVIVEPHFFWCQYANTEDLTTASKLAQEAGKVQQDEMSLETFIPGSPCLALFSSDNQWYRAQVMERNGDTVLVVFIDYGNECDVDIKDVKTLPQSLLEVAPQAFLCTLNGFDESKGSWDEQVYEDFYNLLVDKPLKLTIYNVEDHPKIAVPQYAVKIECEGEVVNDAMQKYWKPVAAEQVVTESFQTECTFQSAQSETNIICSVENDLKCTYNKPKVLRNKTEVYASCIEDPHFFWCQYANAQDLSKVSTLAHEAGQAQQKVMDLGALGSGSPCLALFANDNRWHRAKVIQKIGDTVNVLFVDYGSESKVDIQNVRSLPLSLLEIAPQAFLCCLSGFDKSNGFWDEKVYDDFYSLLVDKPLQLTVVNVKDYSEFAVPQYVVQVESGNVIVNEAIQKYWNTTVMEKVTKENPLQCSQTQTNTTHCNVFSEDDTVNMYKRPKISNVQMYTVYASCISEPNFFWCQYANTDDLSKVSKFAQEAGQMQPDTALGETLGPGSPCLAQFNIDNQWYRAQVIQKYGDTLHVVFVDYGNESDVDIQDVRPLPPTLMEMAPQAFLCSLNGFDASKGSWDEQAYDAFYNLLVDKPLRVMVLNEEHHAFIALPQFTVEVECEGAVVNMLMEKYWKELDTAGSFESALDSDKSLWETKL